MQETEQKIPCIVHIICKNGDFSFDDNAKLSEVANNFFTVETKLKTDAMQIKNIVVNFVEGKQTVISISGIPKRIEVYKNRTVYHCAFSYSVGAEKYTNIHRPKEGAGHPVWQKNE